ncbi:DnaJ family molecular chaperone [Glycocaulis sp.]|uniref:J domain-containing protein n=1 Tax=Glycocaulis sp. TaxID=1969725 RepID=UPI0025C1C144|nr:DnaJ family molecular chaperone [Glycocaulis sp.]MCH8522297.1 DnaJ family molecular chaperone [Glycocaulis sp.]
MGVWRKLADLITGGTDPFDCPDGDCPPGHRVDDAEFAMALIGLGAKMAKADGQVTGEEVAAFRQVLKAPPAFEASLMRAFHLAKQTTLGFEGYARRLARRFRAHPAILEDVLDGLFHIAKADGRITGEEMDFLDRVADIFGFTESEFDRIRAGHGALNGDDPYLVLGVDRSIADADLKRAYRRIASQNHPDMLIARGAPPEMQRVADEKMAVINAAYQSILAARGLKPAAA